MASQLGSKKDEANLLMYHQIGSGIKLYNIISPTFFSALEVQDSKQSLFDVGVNSELTRNDVDLQSGSIM